MLETIGGGGGVTPIVVEAPLLPVLGSGSLPLRLTTAWNDGPDVGLTTMVPLTVAPDAMFPREQVINVVDAVQFPCEKLPETNVTLPGRGEVTVTPLAGDGPLFVTPIVYVTLLPA
jgi:hypothetical protein